MSDKELKERIVKANEKYMGLVEEFIASVGMKDIASDDVQDELCKMLLCLFADWQKEQTINKACDAYCQICGHYPHSVPTHICRQDCQYYTDFRKAMEEEK